jgi:hypothetical protein
MQISVKSIHKLAEMICGSNGAAGGYGWSNFPYRSSSRLSEFFIDAGLPHRHDGSSRKAWMVAILEKENLAANSNGKLPSDSMILILQTLLDARSLADQGKKRAACIEDVNGVLKWDHLRVFADDDGVAQVEAIDGGATSVGTLFQMRRAWTEAELKRKAEFARFLDSASEDEITEKLLVPLFLHLGFARISVAGHQDKRLEFGTDLWMKFSLPTKHALYFGCQIKRDKIDAAGKSNTNIAGILNQITMMLDYPIWDPESNRKQLLDHVYIISGGEITKQAKNWLGEHLDGSKRRHIIFLDRAELLDLLVGNQMAVPSQPDPDQDVPF